MQNITAVKVGPANRPPGFGAEVSALHLPAFCTQGWQEEFACVTAIAGGPSSLRSSGRPAEATNVCFNARL